jgi:putative Holliday junction resolvase
MRILNKKILPAGYSRGGFSRINMVSEPGRILALDLGRKRIGLAISDELGITAQGLETVERAGRREDIEILRRLAAMRGVRLFLLGDPLHMSGEASRQ